MINFTSSGPLHGFKSMRADQKILILSALTLPVIQKISIVCWIVSGITSIYFYVKSEKKTQFSISLPSVLLPVLYILYGIGLLWTSNLGMGYKIMQEKLTLLLLPLILIFLPSGKEFRDYIKLAFVAGCFLNCILMEGIAFYRYMQSHDQMVFFYTSFASVLPHPTYISMYINLSLLILLEFYLEERISWLKNLPFLSLTILLFISLIQLSSRMAQATCFITYAFALLYSGRIIKFNFQKKYYIFLIIIIASISYIGFQKLYSRFDSKTLAKGEYSSSTSRIEIWKESITILKQTWLLGAGTGDIKDILQEKYKENDFSFAADRRLNPHNEYLQVWLSVGIAGFLIYILIILIPIRTFAFSPEFSLFLFPFILGFNSLTESIIETQKGILFFSFFYAIFYRRGPESTGKIRETIVQ